MTPDPTHLFKFVSVRPAQLATDDESRLSVIRDSRAGTPAGLEKLKAQARKISSPDAALRAWQAVDLTSLKPLAAARQALVRQYAGLGESDPPLGGAKAIRAAGLPGNLAASQDQISQQAWDALYIAHASGPDAGQRLETPIGALRVLHFVGLFGDAAPSAANALTALGAVPAIAPELDAALRPLAGKPQAEAVNPQAAREPAADPAALERVRQMATDLNSSRELLSALASAVPVAPVVRTSPAETTSRWSRQQVAASTAPALRAVLGDEISRDHAALLDSLGVSPDTSVPLAVQMLDRHVTALSDQALRLSNDPEFQAHLETIAPSVKGISPGAAFAVPAPGVPVPAVPVTKVPVPGVPVPGVPVPAVPDPSSAPDVDVHGRIKPLGIGDLKVVKETLLDYEPGEVAYIENVLKGETKQRVFRTLDRTVTTVFTSEVDTSVTEKDTQATDRYELKREAEQTIKEDMSIKAGLTVTASYGPITATATGDFAYSTSKEESQKSSSNFAHDVVDRSISKIETKTTNERTVQTTNEVEETNTHGLDNVGGTEHIIGIYRWVNKRYRAQIYNYGVRMMLEFVVPEPAAFYRAARAGAGVKVDATPPIPFLNDLTPMQPIANATRLSAGDITEQNYYLYAARYGATGISPPPPLQKYIGASLSKDGLDDGKSIAQTSSDFVVPDGYSLSSYSVAMSVLWINWPKFTAQVGGDIYVPINNGGGGNSFLTWAREGAGSLTPVNGPVPVSVSSYDVHAFAVNVQGVCVRSDNARWAWQLQTYDKIEAAYQALQTAYDHKVAQAHAADSTSIVGQNPLLNQSIMQTELKKLCITMMTGQHFSQFRAMTDPSDKPTHYPEIDVDQALHDGPIVQFFEQAFEWEQMTFLFYPYFWGRKENWVTISGLSDPDPVFSQFLTAGSCRVVVPVPVAYVDAVLYMLQSPASDLAAKVWGGGEAPTLDSPLYVSLAQELRNRTDDLAGATPEGDPWEYTLPTTLVWLQPDSALPRFP